MIDAPTTPFASRYGVPEPACGFFATAASLAFASFNCSSSVYAPPPTGVYCAAANGANDEATKRASSTVPIIIGFFILVPT